MLDKKVFCVGSVTSQSLRTSILCQLELLYISSKSVSYICLFFILNTLDPNEN